VGFHEQHAANQRRVGEAGWLASGRMRNSKPPRSEFSNKTHLQALLRQINVLNGEQASAEGGHGAVADDGRGGGREHVR